MTEYESWVKEPISQSDLAAARSFILDHPEIDYLLVMNEPNLVDQANRTPTQAVDDWLIYEQFLFDLANNDGRELKLVGPNVQSILSLSYISCAFHMRLDSRHQLSYSYSWRINFIRLSSQSA